MPEYPWLTKNLLDGVQVTANMKALRKVGVPYSDEDIAKAAEDVNGKTELDALIAHLQGLGLALK
jgi:cytochrome c oxidase cbb3-type subunit 2